MSADAGGGELQRGGPALAGAALGVATSPASLSYYTYGVFGVALGTALGWSSERMSWGTLLFGLGLAVGSPLAGWAVDRAGPLLPVAVGVASAALGYLLLGSFGHVFAAFIALHIAIGLLSAGSSPVTYTRVVNARFAVHRGLALGATLAAAGIMAYSAPPAMARLIDATGWRDGYRALALATVVFGGGVLLLLGRDARRPPSPRAATAAGPAARSLGDAIRDPLFLRLALAFVLLATGLGCLSVHLQPLLMHEGYAKLDAAKVQGSMGLAVLGGRLVSGWLCDRVFAPWVGAATMLIGAAGLIGLAAGGPAAAPAFAVMVGLAQGSEGDLIGYLTARYFGMASYGRLYGALLGLYTVALGFSPLLVALLMARLGGGYAPALSVCAGLIATGALILATSPRFRTA